MTEQPRTAGTHPVYPGGPDCQPNCPGPWSMYHDGYADGYENAEAADSPALGLLRKAETASEAVGHVRALLAWHHGAGVSDEVVAAARRYLASLPQSDSPGEGTE